MYATLSLAFLIAGTLLMVATEAWLRHYRRRRIKERLPISIEEWVRYHYGSHHASIDHMTEIRTALDRITQIIHVDPMQLRPSDRLDLLAGADLVDCDDTYLVATVIESVIGSQENGKAHCITTIDDLISIICKSSKVTSESKANKGSPSRD